MATTNVPPQVAAAIPNITAATKANATQATANANLGQGVNVSSNLTRTNAAANTAVNNYQAAANKLNVAASNETSMSRKNKLMRAANAFSRAAVSSAANQPTNAANHANRGIKNLQTLLAPSR